MIDSKMLPSLYFGRIADPSDSFIWGDFIDESICDGLIDFFNTQDIITPHRGRIGREGASGDADLEFKESTDVAVPAQLDIPIIKSYREALQEVHDKYVDKFIFSDTGDYGIVQPMNIQKYPPNGGYKTWHSERIGSETWAQNRHLVFMTYLNSIENGGTEWYHQKKYVPAVKGYTVIWPSDWTHTHRGRITDQEKIIITGWFTFV